MPDWPSQSYSTLPAGAITSISSSSLAQESVLALFAAVTAGTWPAANRAIYAPFFTEVPVTVYQIGFEVAVQSGNLDVGLYDYLGNRLVSKGSTAVAAAGFQAVDITDTALVPGVYYTAMCVDNITASFRVYTPVAAVLQMCGAQQQAVGVVTLPDPAVFANPASAYLPMMTLALTSVL